MANENIQKFADAILSDAADQKQRIMDEVAQQKQKEMEQKEEEVLKEIYAFIQTEINKIKTLSSKEISTASQDAKKEILKVREEIITKVYESLKQKITAFLLTGEYKIFLERKMQKMPIDSAYEVRKEDIETVREILKKRQINSNITENTTIKYGGFYAKPKTKSIIIDETIDNKIAESVEYFEIMSKLGI